MEMILKIKLLSDTCLGGSNVGGGIVDTEIVTDAYGIPCIPAKRIKGLFREMAMELSEFGFTDEKTVEELFGKNGNQREAIHFQTLYPEGWKELKDFLDAAKYDAVWKEYAQKKKVLDYYTTVRSQTALEESGIAKTNSLRMIRVVKKNHTFYGNIECPDGMGQDKVEVLKYCAKMIRHVGMNRTRGMGNVECELLLPINKEEISSKEVFRKLEKNYQTDVTYSFEKDKELPVRVRFTQPCALDTDYITGGVLRGMYAAKYAQCIKNTDLHQQALFQDLFLENKVKFGYCWPIQKDSRQEDKLYLPTPNSFVQTRKVSDGTIYDLAGYEADDLDEVLNEKERCKVPFVNIDGEDVYGYFAKRRENYHHRRPEDRSAGHALKSKGAPRTSDGQLYTREFLCEDQEFYGVIRGPENLLKVLKQLIPSGQNGYVGASRTAEYGNVSISYDKWNAEMEPVETEDRLVITCVSPMVVMDEFGNDTTDAEVVAKEILGDNWDDSIIIRSYCKEELVSGYNAKWNMPIPQRNVLTPGSEIVLYGDGLEALAEDLNGRSYGLYQNEGYGYILVNWHGDCETLDDEGEYTVSKEKEVPAYSSPKNTNILPYLNACLEHKVQELCSMEADTDICYKLRRCLRRTPNSHTLSGLQKIYKTSVDFKDFGEQMKKASSRATKRNGEWFDSIYDLLFAERMARENNDVKYSEQEKIVQWNVNNEFCKQGIGKIQTCRFDKSYKAEMERLLKTNSYSYFSGIFGTMIYDVHLELNKGGR